MVVVMVVVVVSVQNTSTLQVQSNKQRVSLRGVEEWRQTIPVIHAELRNGSCSHPQLRTPPPATYHHILRTAISANTRVV